MIRSFRCRETEKVFNRIFSRRLPENIQRVVLRKLRMLNRIRINDQWRICFRWEKGDAHEVEIVDYH